MIRTDCDIGHIAKASIVAHLAAWSGLVEIRQRPVDTSRSACRPCRQCRQRETRPARR